MVRRNANPGPDWKRIKWQWLIFFSDCDSMFLIRVLDGALSERRPAVDVRHKPEAGPLIRTRGTSVLRQRQSSRFEQDLIAARSSSDHRSEVGPIPIVLCCLPGSVL
jgi:hypothetical protein